MEQIKDRVCGAELEEEKVAASFDYKGETYQFCSESCRDTFSRTPDAFIIV